MNSDKLIKTLTNVISLLVLIAFIILSIIVQVRDAAMDAASVSERHELRERLDAADRDRNELRGRVEKLEGAKPLTP